MSVGELAPPASWRPLLPAIEVHHPPIVSSSHRRLFFPLSFLIPRLPVAASSFVPRPTVAASSVSSVRIATLSLSAADALTSCFDLNVTAHNPNKKLVYIYDPISVTINADDDVEFVAFVQDAIAFSSLLFEPSSRSLALMLADSSALLYPSLSPSSLSPSSKMKAPNIDSLTKSAVASIDSEATTTSCRAAAITAFGKESLMEHISQILYFFMHRYKVKIIKIRYIN